MWKVLTGVVPVIVGSRSGCVGDAGPDVPCAPLLSRDLGSEVVTFVHHMFRSGPWSAFSSATQRGTPSFGIPMLVNAPVRAPTPTTGGDIIR